MNTYLTEGFVGYPVVFSGLHAANGGQAFGIFVLLFFVAFFFRGTGFLCAYIEQIVFVPSRLTVDDDTASDEKIGSTCSEEEAQTTTEIVKERSTLAKFFQYSPHSLYRDFIRLLIVFVSAMLGYGLMLAAMSFVLLYFFAVVLGIAFGEIFFLRLSNVMGLTTSGGSCVSLH